VELHNHGVHGSGLLQPPDLCLNEDNDPDYWIWTRNNWFPEIFADVNINGSNNYNHNGTNATTNNYNNANDYYNNYSNNINSSNEHNDNNTHDKDNKTTLTNGANFDLETLDRILRESEPTSDAPDYSASFDGQFIQLSCQAIPPGGSIQDEVSSYGADAEGEPKDYKTTHQGNNSDATVNTDGGISISVEELESYIRDVAAEPTSASTSVAAVSSAAFDCQFNHQAYSHTTSVTEPIANIIIEVNTEGSVPPTPSAGELFKRPPKDSEASEFSPKKPRKTKDAPNIESVTPLQRTPVIVKTPPATNTGSSPKKTTGTDPSNPRRCYNYRQREKAKRTEKDERLKKVLKADEADLKSLGISIVTISALMDASQKITKAAKWRSSFEFFKFEPLLPSDEQKVRRQKSVRNCRAKDKAVKALKLRMMTTLNAENIPTLGTNIRQLQQDQALLAQQHQQQLEQNSGSPTPAQQPESQPQPQQQAQMVQSGASGGVQTITVNQQQPQVIQLQLQQQQQAQPQQQQQQQAQPHHQQPGAAAVPPGGIQIVQQLITPTGEIHQILPVQLNAEQLQVLRAQMVGGAGSSQPIVIQTAPIQTQLAQPAQTVQTIQLLGGQYVYNIQQQY